MFFLNHLTFLIDERSFGVIAAYDYC